MQDHGAGVRKLHCGERQIGIMRVKIDKIVEGMEFQGDTSVSYLNRRTGPLLRLV